MLGNMTEVSVVVGIFQGRLFSLRVVLSSPTGTGAAGVKGPAGPAGPAGCVGSRTLSSAQVTGGSGQIPRGDLWTGQRAAWWSWVTLTRAVLVSDGDRLSLGMEGDEAHTGLSLCKMVIVTAVPGVPA